MANSGLNNDNNVSETFNSYDKVNYNCASPVFDESSARNCIDLNGDVNHRTFNNILPNNNVCGDIDMSHCYIDGECTNNMQNQDSLLSPSNPSTSSPAGESSSQESDSHFELSSTKINSPNSFEWEQKSDFNSSSLDITNGAIKKTSRKKLGMGTTRGRPRKALVAMYHSQISGDKNTIKIRIKKSNLNAQVQLPPNKKKSGRRKKHKTSDTDNSDHEMGKKRKLNVSFDSNVMEMSTEPLVQSVWGQCIPHNILYRIFQITCAQEGCLPLLVRLSRVCRLWRDVALSPSLWHNIDLYWVREQHRTDIRLHWLMQNRLSNCQDLNLGEWKVRDIHSAVEALSMYCTELKGINVSGWKGLNADHLKFLITACHKLERLDLSSINNASTINTQPLIGLAQTMNSRLTHLVLAHNKLAGFSQIIAAIAKNCPNLQLLDISNIRTYAHNTALLYVESLQNGCPKLRVLRMTNSQIWLAPVSLSDQVASPGFPMLEELSLAGIEGDHITARSIDDNGIERILKSSTKLRLLDVRGCIRLTDSGLVRVPAWDLEHLFLSACCVTRTPNSGMELILQKWSHSLVEVDLAWSTATESLDAAVMILTEKGDESPLRVINLCGSSVSLEPVKAILTKCPKLYSINLQSCRALPRGIKRLYSGVSVKELRQSLQDKESPDTQETDSSQTPPAGQFEQTSNV